MMKLKKYGIYKLKNFSAYIIILDIDQTLSFGYLFFMEGQSNSSVNDFLNRNLNKRNGYIVYFKNANQMDYKLYLDGYIGQVNNKYIEELLDIFYSTATYSITEIVNHFNNEKNCQNCKHLKRLYNNKNNTIYYCQQKINIQFINVNNKKGCEEFYLKK